MKRFQTGQRNVVLKKCTGVHQIDPVSYVALIVLQYIKFA